jgi:hypothetical protein
VTIRLLLPDSEVASIEAIDPDIVIRFAAAQALRATEGAALKPTPGFCRGVVLRLKTADVIGRREPLMGRIAKARLQVGGQWWQEVPLPFESHAAVHLELALPNRAYFMASAIGIVVRFEGEPHFAESMAC